jgi:hypothetical protein
MAERAMVRPDDDRAQPLRDMGAEVVVADGYKSVSTVDLWMNSPFDE